MMMSATSTNQPIIVGMATNPEPLEASRALDSQGALAAPSPR